MKVEPMKATLIYASVVMLTGGEFGVATWLLTAHGDAFPLYLATLYFIRERYSGLKWIALQIHKITYRRQLQRERQAQTQTQTQTDIAA